jgi:hypothetical protein
VPEYKVNLIPRDAFALNPTGSWKPYESETEPKAGDEITIEAETRTSEFAPTALRVRITVVEADTPTITVEPIE